MLFPTITGSMCDAWIATQKWAACNSDRPSFPCHCYFSFEVVRLNPLAESTWTHGWLAHSTSASVALKRPFLPSEIPGANLHLPRSDFQLQFACWGQLAPLLARLQAQGRNQGPCHWKLRPRWEQEHRQQPYPERPATVSKCWQIPLNVT